jgi:hypothetical protein
MIRYEDLVSDPYKNHRNHKNDNRTVALGAGDPLVDLLCRVASGKPSEAFYAVGSKCRNLASELGYELNMLNLITALDRRLVVPLALLGCLALMACGESSGGGGSGTTPRADATATYSITFKGLWTETNFPFEFPPPAHFSPLIGAAHNATIHLWEVGTLATDGIEEMAETGSRTALSLEIQAFIIEGKAAVEVRGPRIEATTSITRMLPVPSSHPLLTLVSMVAPSPDGFVGIDSYDLAPGGVWINNAVIDLVNVYDSGTDTGTTFTSAEANEMPASTIERLLDTHFQDNGIPIARLTIARM